MPVQTRSSTKKQMDCSIATDENHWVTDSDDGTNDSEIRLITRDVCEIKNPPKYDVDIDFDNASRAWRSNKRRDGESWVYVTKRLKNRGVNFRVIENVNRSHANKLLVSSSIGERVKINRRSCCQRLVIRR